MRYIDKMFIVLRQPTISIKAKLKILPKENGNGRETPIRSGYRPNHVFEYVEGRIVTIDMSKPWGFSEVGGKFIFDVHKHQLTEIEL